MQIKKYQEATVFNDKVSKNRKNIEDITPENENNNSENFEKVPEFNNLDEKVTKCF